MTWHWDLSLLEKFVVNVQCATMKYEIIKAYGTTESRN